MDCNITFHNVELRASFVPGGPIVAKTWRKEVLEILDLTIITVWEKYTTTHNALSSHTLYVNFIQNPP